jgi:hypothetical protein
VTELCAVLGRQRLLAVNLVDDATEMIQIRQQVIVVDRHPVLAPPKTSASVRDLPVPKFLQEAIARHVSELSLADSDVLCRTPRRTLLRRDYYNREIWKPALAAAELPADATFHDLRQPSPAPPSPSACRSPRYPAGLATSRSRPPSTCTATWSLRPAAGPATRSTARLPRSGDVPQSAPATC